jgi:hypothetical protein
VPAAKLLAAAALVLLAAAPREFGIGGGPILCVPDREIDLDATPYRPDAKHLQAGDAAFSFRFGADTVRQHVPGFAVDPALADLSQVNTLDGSLGFASETGSPREAPRVTCRREVLRHGNHAGAELRTCTRAALIDGMSVAYQVQERNAALVAEIDRFLAGKIAEWRDNCHATDRM